MNVKTRREYVDFYNEERIGCKTPREKYLEYISLRQEVLSKVGELVYDF